MVTREVSRLFEILKTSNEDLLINQTLLKQEQSKLRRNDKKNEVQKWTLKRFLVS